MPQCVGLSCRFSGRATIRGGLALKRKHIIAAKARENYENYVGRPSKSCKNSDTIIEKIDTKKELAKIAGVSHDTLARVHGSGRCTLPFRTFAEFCKSPPPLLRYSCDTPRYPSGILSGWRSSPYGLLWGSLLRSCRQGFPVAV